MASLLTEMLADSPTMLLRGNEASGTTANDSSSGGTHDGTRGTNVTFGAAALVATDTSMDFAATDPNYVDVADHADFDRGDGAFSYVVVLKQDVIGVTRVLADKGVTGGVAWGIYISSVNRVRLQTADGGVNMLSWSNTGAGFTDTASRHMLVVTYDGTNPKMYMDGSDVTEAPTDATIANSSSVLRIGAAQDGSNMFNGQMAYAAYFPSALSAARVSAYWASIDGVDGPVWTTPADTVSMSTTPDLKFTSPTSAVKQHFYMQLDTVNTFNSGNLRTYDSSTSQTNWTYYNGASWVAIPSDGLPIAYSGNEVDYTVTSALSGATWYRRVRAGTLV